MASFGQKIRGIRFHLGMSQEEMGRLLQTSKQNISRYENEQNSPRIDTVDAIAKALGISITFLLNDEFSVQETIDAFEHGSAQVHLPKQDSSIIRRTVRTMQRLNDEGQLIVANTADGLDLSGQYKRESSQIIELEDRQYEYVATDARAAAGAGAYNEDGEATYRKLALQDEPDDYDAIVEITGDSMEPTIKDGDLAFINFSFCKKDGAIYVVQVGEDTLIKRCFFRPDRIILRSDNPDYQDRFIEEIDRESSRVIGQVVEYATPKKT